MSSIRDKYAAVAQSLQPSGAPAGSPPSAVPGAAPGWITDPNGVPFSRRATPELYSNWLATSQDSPSALMAQLESDRTVPERLKKVIRLNFIPQHKRDGLLSAIYPNEAAEIQADKKVNILKARVKCYPDDAHNPVVANLESQRREHILYYHSRDQRDEFNERQNLIKGIITTETRGEVRHIFPEEAAKKPGVFGRFLRGGA